MKKKKPLIGVCEKCGTENSYLTEYDGRYLCSANACWTEETENDSEIFEIRDDKLNEYRRMCQATRS